MSAGQNNFSVLIVGHSSNKDLAVILQISQIHSAVFSILSVLNKWYFSLLCRSSVEYKDCYLFTLVDLVICTIFLLVKLFWFPVVSIVASCKPLWLNVKMRRQTNTLCGPVIHIWILDCAVDGANALACVIMLYIFESWLVLWMKFHALCSDTVSVMWEETDYSWKYLGS